MAIKALEISRLQPRTTAYKVADDHGLYLQIQPSGAKLWRFKFRFRGVEKKLSIGKYPEVSLKAAREKRDDARRMLSNGIDPAAAKRQAIVEATIGAATTFRLVADEFVDKMEREGKKAVTIKKARWFRDLVDQDIGHRPVSEVTPHELLNALRKVERKGHHETAHRLRAFASRVFRYAVVTLRAKDNPADLLRGALTAPQVTHHAAILDPKLVGALLRSIEGYSGKQETHIALKIAPHVFVRPGELRQAEWQEFDLDAAVWRIPAAKMKMAQPHAVPLSTQVIGLLRQLRGLSNAGSFLFPAFHTTRRCMSENTLNSALRRLGYGGDEMTSHGFRAVASTLLNESGLWHPDAIERSLAHKDPDQVRAAYHRGAHWAERVRMMQWWSDYLDQLRDGAQILTPSFRRA
ncbi:integrase arm-type DNA-binding domain-containing protein [Sphingomonas sp. G-3-2-10]|uniref:tyrosine-type recombinase/integrase n=1 Tax=Sphingomonas sp. G-3-2-10 TaxID=2728838 RepID=UPI00146E0FA6|nr:integrase arm-type DNA-binding domain-containing protein [Sphingomonas sp. G-3-2-10]NML08341.1 integrase arm-type DNA-binding domain-containing protein [Sphingomonas sp. G-3-2-10]